MKYFTKHVLVIKKMVDIKLTFPPSNFLLSKIVKTKKNEKNAKK